MKLDKWQEAVMKEDGNVVIRSGRQVGKSTVISHKAVKFAEENEGVITLVIAASQKQSGFIFDKMRGILDAKDELNYSKVMKGKKVSVKKAKELFEKHSVYAEMPTKTRIVLKNGSKIYSLPAGRSGIYIRGLTIDLLVCDEAAYIPDAVFNSVLPMLAVSRKQRGFGHIILLSTPFGKGGYFYDAFHDRDFRSFHVSSEKCPRISKTFLMKEKRRMTKMEYAQEYLGEFIDDFRQFFPTSLLKNRMTFIEWSFEKQYRKRCSYYLGVDIARYGGDENAFVISEIDRAGKMRIVRAFTTRMVAITDTIGRILDTDKMFKFRKIFIDDAGVGGGATDVLIEKLGRRVVGINNSKRSVDREGHKKAIMKQDLYSNMLVMLETDKLEMVSDLPLLQSLKNVTYEYTEDGRFKIFGPKTHLAEAAVRACWATRNKGLKLFLS